MKLLEGIYRLRGKPVPYYAKYSLLLLLWKPIRKFVNVVIVPNVPFAILRVLLYRGLGFRIGKNVFIGMRCYMDDVDPVCTVIEDDVTISYGCYFAVHGRRQTHTLLRIRRGAYLGLRCTVISGKHGVTIGENAVIGAAALVNRDIPPNTIAVGVPARVIGIQEESPREMDRE